MSQLRERLIGMAEPLLGDLGFELVDLEYLPQRASAIVRVFLDRLDRAVVIEDCEQVSRALAALLDVEDPIPVAYTLEVSSPGLDRVLRTPAHFGRFVGERVHVELKQARDGRRRYTGQLAAVSDSGVELNVDGAPVALSFTEIGRANLAPQWPEKARRR